MLNKENIQTSNNKNVGNIYYVDTKYKYVTLYTVYNTIIYFKYKNVLLKSHVILLKIKNK